MQGHLRGDGMLEEAVSDPTAAHFGWLWFGSHSGSLWVVETG